LRDIRATDQRGLCALSLGLGFYTIWLWEHAMLDVLLLAAGLALFAAGIGYGSLCERL
jgi:hypothetical protein